MNKPLSIEDIAFETKTEQGLSSRRYLGIRGVAEAMVNGDTVKLFTAWKYLDPDLLGDMVYDAEEELKQQHLDSLNLRLKALDSIQPQKRGVRPDEKWYESLPTPFVSGHWKYN